MYTHLLSILICHRNFLNYWRPLKNISKIPSSYVVMYGGCFHPCGWDVNKKSNISNFKQQKILFLINFDDPKTGRGQKYIRNSIEHLRRRFFGTIVNIRKLLNCFRKRLHLRYLTGFWIHLWRVASKVLELALPKILKISWEKEISQVYPNLSEVLGEGLSVSDYFKSFKNENWRWKCLNHAEQINFFVVASWCI